MRESGLVAGFDILFFDQFLQKRMQFYSAIRKHACSFEFALNGTICVAL
ncbi:hypothetical protein Metfor_2510 [Methanoregula formicica SMSP]|uniref:Uncharacterized protein n=1 Tax=Methanoregula formicica (strain DSM 22288 / NBRC 105244 / SMSP) TaxID=593750 RepID=L0HKA4_METFS|nr:hypothetical protein Metfor_2510 [Methanoregula formicica SMSP]